MTKEKLIVDLCNDGIIQPDQALKMLASSIGLTDEEAESFLSKISMHFKDRTGIARWTEWDDENIVTMYGDYHSESDGGLMELISLSPDGIQTTTCKSSERGPRQAGGTMGLWHTPNCE